MSENREFISGIVPPQERSAPAWWFIFMKDKLLVHQEPESVTVPFLIDPNELGLTVMGRTTSVNWITAIAMLLKWLKEHSHLQA
jgi:hypothetical protein